jgi:hypothetical protein
MDPSFDHLLDEFFEPLGNHRSLSRPQDSGPKAR